MTINMTERTRLDQALVASGQVVSRARARDLIRRGEVMVNGIRAEKPSMRVSDADTLTLKEGAGDYVSRGALKLKAALDAFGLDPAGRVALDVGASTGGFTDVLLRRGARKVYAVDNGRAQLHPSLRADSRVVLLERIDARCLSRSLIEEPVSCIVADVSFISLTKVLGAPLDLAAPGCWLVALIKPQYEAEPNQVPRSGVISDPNIQVQACRKVLQWMALRAPWRILGVIPSPITGGDGNAEFLLGATRDGG